MTKDNILIYSIAYAPYIGGAEIAWQEITNRITDFEFYMITPLYNKKNKRREKIKNVHIIRIGIGHQIDKFLLPIIGPLYGYFLHKKINFKLIIGIIYNHAGLAAMIHKKIQKNIPFLLNLQDGDTDEVIRKKTYGLEKILRSIYTTPDYITTIAFFLSDRAKKNGYKKQPIIIPNGVDIEKFSKKTPEKTKEEIRKTLNIKEKDRIIITTSRLNYKNAINDLICSLQYLDDTYHVVIIGQGEEEKKLKEIASLPALKNRVHFLGFVTHDNIVQYLHTADYFCRPSLQEGLGNSFLEAMAARIPVIAPPVGGIPDFLEHKKTGMFCKIKDPQSIALNIKILENDSLLLQNIIKKAQTRVIKKYHWDKIAKKYNNLFHHIT